MKIFSGCSSSVQALVVDGSSLVHFIKSPVVVIGSRKILKNNRISCTVRDAQNATY